MRASARYCRRGVMLMVPQRDAVAAARIGADLLGRQVLSADPVRRGGNNRIFLLSGDDARAILKFYPLQQEDARDRLGQEFAALSFLQRCGVENVPRPLACDRARSCAVYEWIDGTVPDRCGAAEVDALADF